MGDDFQRLRRMVPVRADWHLTNWGRWRRIPERPDGYPERSAGLSTGGISGADAFDHMCDDADINAAEVCDSVISDLDLNFRRAISHVYEASVWRFNRIALEDLFVLAVERFWKAAQAKGIWY